MDSTAPAGAAASLTTFSSPIDHFFNNYLPKDHETALRQAIYNALALDVFLGLVLGGYYVFVVLQPFVTPMFWAILTGFVLHPYKCSISERARTTLQNFTDCQSTLAYVVLRSSCTSTLAFCDAVGGYVFSHIKIILLTLLFIPASYFAFQLQPTLLYALLDWLAFFWSVPSHPVFQSFQLYQILGLWLLFLGSLLFLSHNTQHHHSRWVRSFSLLTWAIMGCYLSSLLWTSILHLSCFGVFAYAVYRHQQEGSASSDSEASSPASSTSSEPMMSRIQALILRGFSAMFGGVIDGEFLPEESRESEDSSHEKIIAEEIEEEEQATEPAKEVMDKEDDSEKKEEEEDQVETDAKADVDGVRRVKSLPGGADSNVKRVMMASTPTVTAKAPVTETPNVDVIQHPGIAALKQQHMQVRPSPNNLPSHSVLGPTPNRSHFGHSTRNATTLSKRRKRFRTTFHLKESIDLADKASTVYIRGVFWACLVLQFYKHPGLLHLLPIPICVFGLRKIFFYFKLDDPVKKRLAIVTKWLEERRDVLVPWPVQKLLDILYQMERTCLSSLPNYIDGLVTTLLILVLIVVLIVFTVFVSFELYTESAYMMQNSGKLFTKMANSSTFRQLNDSIWDPGYQTGLDNMLETAYHSGRDYISQNIHTLIGDSKDESAINEIETKVLELWDRMYQYWLERKQQGGGNTTGEEQGPSLSKEAISTSVDEIVDKILDHDFFNYASIVQFLKDNMDTLQTILEQTWVLLQGNIRFVMTLVLEILKLLASSGSGFVNGVLSIIVYFTALFYLLTNSNQTYKPIEVMSNHGHILGEGFGAALHKAVNSIFSLTFRMATFYGLWTYLTHSVFNVSIVMVPVLAATFLAAVPVAGQYLVAVPAALELWLADDRWIAAILLILCHFLPMMVVDGAIYGEVKGGIHPWLTGLSIVGGIYYFGVAGTIYGPLILCGVFVVLSMYTGFMQDQGGAAGETLMGGGNKSDAAGNARERSRFQTPMFKRSESIY